MYELSEFVFLALALSIDTFAVAMSCGFNNIKMNRLSVLIITLINTGVLFISMTAASFILLFITKEISKYISFSILFILGIIKLIKGGGNNITTRLSLRETVMLGFSIAGDVFAAGIGMPASPIATLPALVILFGFTIVSLLIGNRFGKGLSGRLKLNFSRFGGLILITLSFLRLK